ncbi:transcriptional regulator, y4mF family [compost metagenome]
MGDIEDVDFAAMFGKVLRQKRKEAGLTQDKLAEQADIQRTYVSMLERGEYQPTITIIFKLAKGLACTPASLVADLERLVNG